MGSIATSEEAVFGGLFFLISFKCPARPGGRSVILLLQNHPGDEVAVARIPSADPMGQQAFLIGRSDAFPDSAEDDFLPWGLVKASIRNDPQSDYSGIRRSDVASHRTGDRALDRRRPFD
jgi:hypothetical protein